MRALNMLMKESNVRFDINKAMKESKFIPGGGTSHVVTNGAEAVKPQKFSVKNVMRGVRNASLLGAAGGTAYLASGG